MKHLLFTERMKMADLVHANYRLLYVLPRFGIQLGFGDKSIEEICPAHNLAVSLLLLVCNVSLLHTSMYRLTDSLWARHITSKLLSPTTNWMPYRVRPPITR